jgi:hypothetical protein
VIGNDDAQDGIAKELETFVRRVTSVLGTPGTVDERRREESRSQLEAEALHQFFQTGYGERIQGSYSRPKT